LLHSAAALQRLAGYLLGLRQQGIVLKFWMSVAASACVTQVSILHRAKPMQK